MSAPAVNQVVLVGRLTKDPESRPLKDGASVCELRLARRRSAGPRATVHRGGNVRQAGRPVKVQRGRALRSPVGPGARLKGTYLPEPVAGIRHAEVRCRVAYSFEAPLPGIPVNLDRRGPAIA